MSKPSPHPRPDTVAELPDPARMPAASEPPPPAEPKEGDVINNRYRVGRKLGHGGMGSVFLVEDTWRAGRLLALKRVRKDRLDPRTIGILRNEFLALSPLSHPNLARVYDFEVDLLTKDYFFTSEYVDGVQLLKAARDFRIGRREDFARFLETLVQILRALEFIHSRGLVHGDIKPENILIAGSLYQLQSSESSGDVMAWSPKVKMIDFGLTKREKEFGGKRILGTTYYIAPETILGSQVDRRTDLYSLGVLLYHIVTRKLPFTGDSSMAVLRGHIEKAPNPPSVVEPAVPEPLSKLILRLMEKQPASRYSSALELIDVLNAEFGTQFPLETVETRLSYIQSGGFIAREQEMSELANLFESVYRPETPAEAEEELNVPAAVPAVVTGDLPAQPQGRMILIHGEPGVGKRRLLKQFRRYVQTRGAHYLEIDCSGSGEGARRSFAELILAQVGLLSARSPEEMPDQSRLQAFLMKIQHDRSDVPLSLRPAVEKLAYKLLKLSSETPMVMAFTDLQHADAVLLEFLRALIGAIASQRVPDSQVMVVATAEDDAEDSPLPAFLAADNLRSLIRELPLSRFNFEEVSRLVTGVFGPGGQRGNGPFNDRHIRLIYEESDGNPGVVGEILELLVSSDRLRRTTSGWACEGLLDRDTIPGKVRGELRSRIEQLDSPARQLGTALALLGSGAELEVAVRLAQIPPGTIIDAILALKQAKIVREEPSDDGSTHYSFVHQSAQDILYDTIPEESRAEGHNRAGLLLEQHLAGRKQKDPRRLAHHFLRGGNAGAALRYGMDAAREYTALHLPLKAIEVYVAMRRFALPDNPALARQIDRLIARVHFQVGEYRAASEILQRLSGWSLGPGEPPEFTDERERASILVELGETLSRLANFREAFGCFHEAFRLLKTGGSMLELAPLLLGFAELYHRKGNFQESLRYCDRVLAWEKNLQSTPLESKLYLLLAENHFRLDNKEIAARYCQKGLELVGSKRDVDHLALTLQFLGRFYTYKGRFQKALKNLQNCAVVNQKMGAVDRQADCLREIAAILLLLDDPQNARAHLDQAIGIYERTENLADCVEVLRLRGEALRILGYYDEAQKDLQRALQLNAGIGSVQSAAENYLTCAKIALDLGQTKRAERFCDEAERRWKDDLDNRVPLGLIVLRCSMEIVRGRFAEALDLAARGTIAARETGNRLRVVPHQDLMVRLYLHLGRITEASRSLASVGEMGERYGLPVLEGRRLLLSGMLLVAEGMKEEAGQAFNRALAIFHEERSERDLASAYLECGRLQLAMKNYDQAYLLFEEGLYLAKKLNLAYIRCQFHHLMGLLEKEMPEAVFARVAGYFLSAEKVAQAVPFPDLLWRIRRDLGKFYLDSSRLSNADRTLTAALEARREQLEMIPADFRESYLAAASPFDLEALQAEARARAEAQTRKERVKYPPRDPERNEYFDLVGCCPAMRELYRALSALPPDAPWVWVYGAPGSGRRQVARAIHRQSVPDREGLWVMKGWSLTKPEWEKFLAEMEKARAALPEGLRAGQAVDFPGRFSLIISDAAHLPPEIQRAAFEKVMAERGRADGLRVIATVDRALENFKVKDPKEERGEIIAELLGEDFPAFRVPLLSERGDDVTILVEHFLQADRPKDSPAPRLTPDAIEAIRKVTHRSQVRELRELCEKIGRLGGPAATIDVGGISTLITPTLRIARRKG